MRAATGEPFLDDDRPRHLFGHPWMPWCVPTQIVIGAYQPWATGHTLHADVVGKARHEVLKEADFSCVSRTEPAVCALTWNHSPIFPFGDEIRFSQARSGAEDHPSCPGDGR